MDVEQEAQLGQDAPAVADNTEQHMIPKGRFDEINAAKKQAEKELADIRKRLKAFEDAQTEAENRAKLDRGEHEQVIASLRPKADRADKLESVFSGLLERELEAVPEVHRDTITAMLDRIPAVEDKYDALRMQLQLLQAVQPAKPAAPRLDATTRGDGGDLMKATDDDRTWAERLGMSLETYLKQKQAANKERG